MSYTIDIYRRKLEPVDNLLDFGFFVSFFPQLVAGPIERATNLLPQFYTKRSLTYDNAVDGLRQILWGLFKKVVIADNCAVLANMVFNAREAKRLFGFIGAGAITGGIFGGYFASFIAQFTLSENLLFIAIFCLIPCLFLIDKIWEKRLIKPTKKVNTNDNKHKNKIKKHPLTLI